MAKEVKILDKVVSMIDKLKTEEGIPKLIEEYAKYEEILQKE